MSVFRAFAAIVATLALLTIPALAAPDLGPELPEGVRLNASVTVSGASIHLGDVFTGIASNKERVIAPAPRPGQRQVLSADFLANLARTYGIDWRPADAFDRTIVFRPGQTVTQADLLEVLKADLILKGLPETFGLRPSTALPTLTVPAEAMPPVIVRESLYDAASKAFNAVFEIAGGDGASQFLTARGLAVATASVPVLKQDVNRLTVITSEMIELLDVPEEQVRMDTITDAALLIGKSPRMTIQARRPIRDNDVVRISLVDVPVLRGEMRRDSVIHESHISWTTVNAADLPHDAVVNAEYLVGKSPRSFVAGGVPIRRGDVTAVRQVQMAVAARDLPLGTLIQPTDINWVTVGDNEVGTGVIVSEVLTRGRATTRPVRAGQALRAIDLNRPTVITRGKLVTIIYAVSGMKLTAQGIAAEDGAMSQAIRVTNAKSKTSVLAEVVDENTVRIVPQQSAMQ